MVRWVRFVYLIGFVEGTAAHGYDLATEGVRAYAGWPLPVQAFFHSLIVLDPLVVLMLWWRRPPGALLAAAVMVIDVAANWLVSWNSVVADPMRLLNPVGLTAITGFGLFVMLTFGRLRAALIRGSLARPGDDLD